jgi:hypothetical protein
VVHRQASQRFNAPLELVGQAGVVGSGSLLELGLTLSGGEFALDEYFFLWVARKLSHRGESAIGERLQPPQLRHLGAGIGQVLEAAQGLECGGRISGGGGCPLLGPLGICAGAPRAASSLLAVLLTGCGSGLMGRRGSSHGQRKY